MATARGNASGGEPSIVVVNSDEELLIPRRNDSENDEVLLNDHG